MGMRPGVDTWSYEECRVVRGGGDEQWRLFVSALGYVAVVLAGLVLDGLLTEPLLEGLAEVALVCALVLAAAVAASWFFLAAGVPLMVLAAVLSDSSPAFAILDA